MTTQQIGQAASVPVDRINPVIWAAMLLVGALEFGLLPLLLPHGGQRLWLLVPVIALLTPLHWGLVHESLHGSLHGTAAANRLMGRALAVQLLMSWDMVRFGHLTHHDSNRHPLDTPEVLRDGASWIRGGAVYYFMLLFGNAAISVVAPLGVLVPLSVTRRLIERLGQDSELAKIRAAALKAFTNADRRVRIRTDLAIILLLIVVALLCWGAAWPVFVACCVVRCTMLSLLDNAHHYGTSLDSGRNARNTSMPGWARWLILNQNFHGVHHQLPDLNWRELQATFEAAGHRYNSSWIGCVLNQLRGPMRPGSLKPVTRV